MHVMDVSRIDPVTRRSDRKVSGFTDGVIAYDDNPSRTTTDSAELVSPTLVSKGSDVVVVGSNDVVIATITYSAEIVSLSSSSEGSGALIIVLELESE